MNYSKLLKIVTPPRNTLLLIVFLLSVSSLVALANPWIAGVLTEAFLNESPGGHLSFEVILLAWLGLILARGLLGFATSYLVGTTGIQMAAQLRSRVYDHLQFLPLNYFQDRRQGEILTLLSNDSAIISDFVTKTVVQLLPLTVTFFGAVLIMAWLDLTIAALAVAFMPLYFLAMKIIGRKIRPLSSQWIDAWSRMMGLAQENLSLIPAIKAFGRESEEQRRFAHRNQAFRGLSRRQAFIQSILAPAVGFLSGAGLLVLLWVGIRHVQSGQLQTAELVSLLLYAVLLTQPVSSFANVYGQIMRTRGAASRLLEFFGEQPEPLGSGQKMPDAIEGKIEFRDVSFSFPDRPPVFRHFNLLINTRETIALVGKNGSGKTTLAHLLMRFIEPSGGQILIDGHDIQQYDLESLRSKVGIVSQNTLLLNGTIAENIAFGFSDADEAEIKKAAKAAGAEKFIMDLPDGYETTIGDQGIRLSGGQRQRLSLARTLLKNPPILILDEATAMFDEQGETDFLREAGNFLRDRTLILITHRRASIESADRVIELQLPSPSASGAPITDQVPL